MKLKYGSLIKIVNYQNKFDLISNKIADKITSVSKKSTEELLNNETEADVERATPKKRYISQKERQIMEYQKIANLINDAANKPSKFRTRRSFGINDDIRDAYSPNRQIRFKTAMVRSSLCDYSDACTC